MFPNLSSTWLKRALRAASSAAFRNEAFTVLVRLLILVLITCPAGFTLRCREVFFGRNEDTGGRIEGFYFGGELVECRALYDDARLLGDTEPPHLHCRSYEGQGFSRADFVCQQRCSLQTSHDTDFLMLARLLRVCGVGKIIER